MSNNMDLLLILFAIQGALGAFDTIYHHELTERLPWRPNASRELKLHGVRNFFYALIFISLAWIAWHGVLAWILALILVVEIIITLMDFVEEDRTRHLPASERVTHTILALCYGVILALFAPVLWQWSQESTGFNGMNHGLLSWVMTAYALGVFIWGWRDLLRGIYWQKSAIKPPLVIDNLAKPHQHILVTGGTGFIGKPLCQALIDQGHLVTVVTRNMGRAAALFHGRVTCIESLDMLGKSDHFDIVINLAGESISQRWNKRSKARILRSRVDMTQKLVEAMARMAVKPGALISGSAIGFYGSSADQSFDENAPPSTDSLSAFPRDICRLWEAEASKAHALGIRTCLLRTGIVLERDGGALAQMLFPFEFGLGGKLGGGEQWFSWIHRSDLIRLIIHLINDETISGPVNGSAPHPVTNVQMAKALGKAMHRPALLPLPAFQVKLLFGEMGEALLLHGQKVLPQRAQDSGFTFQYPVIDDAFSHIFLR